MKISQKDQMFEKRFMSDLWYLRNKYYAGEDSEEFWSGLYEDSVALSKKYNSRYLDQLILICVDDIEYRYKQSTNSRYMPKDILETVYERLKKKDGDGR